MTHRKSGRAYRHLRAAVLVPTTAAVLLSATGVGYAAPGQPGVTGPSDSIDPAEDQPGVSSSPETPVLPERPQERTPLGDLIPDAPEYAPDEYRYPPSRGGNDSAPAPDYSAPAPREDLPTQYSTPEGGYEDEDIPQQSYPVEPESEPSLGQELQGLHPPQPVEPPKIIVPPPPDRLGVGGATVPRPEWFPDDAAYDINAGIALAQRDTNAFLNSLGVSERRSDRMATGTVLGATSGAAVGAAGAGVPAAVVGGVAGGLIGGTVGGVVGAGAGTFVPVPVIGTVTSGVAGTAVGAGAGAAIGAAALGVPAAVAGGAVGGVTGGVTGAVVTAGDGSDVTPPQQAPAAPPEPAPDVQDQAQQWVDNSVAGAASAVEWTEAQPGGPDVIDAAVDAGQAADTWYRQQPWSPQVDETVTAAAETVVAAADSDPTAAAVVDVVAESPPLAPGQLGEVTGAANDALAAVQGVLR